MRTQLRGYVRKALVALLLAGLAAWLVPSFFSAERYRRRLEAGLEGALHRPVTFGAASFRLLPRPGFSIENAVVGEIPSFGSEPFAHVERIDCELRWHGLWRSRLDFARLRLEHPTLNMVRNERGEWNFENFLLQTGIASPTLGTPQRAASQSAGSFDLVAEDGRLNFQVGVNKKPFAITDLRAELSFVPAAHLIRFHVAGSPIRTDLSLPSPGEVDLAGEWTPGNDLQGPLQATLRTSGALLYDWVPLITGRNPGLYGVVDSEIRLSGTMRVLDFQGDSRLTQLHRWELLPPSDPMPGSVHFRGRFDRRDGHILIESLEASFAASHLHVSGTIDKIPQAPELDLVLSVERSRLEDFVALGRRVWASTDTWDVQGRVDGMVAIQGPWRQRRYGGFLGCREVRFSTSAGNFPISDLGVRIDERGARLAPVKVRLAPGVEVVAEGSLDRAPYPPHYEMGLSAKAVPLRNILSFGRALNVYPLRELDATGVVTGALELAGSAWPPSRPRLAARAELRAARLLVPGLTEPLNLPRVGLRINVDEIVADPVVAVMGTSVFTGRVAHHGERKLPWEFDVRANKLSMEQGALWFDALGRRAPVPLLQRIPGLSSLTARRAAASSLFGYLNARGQFAASSLTYRALKLKDFQAAVEVSTRMVRISQASFRAGGGRGKGSAQVDMTAAPARLTADISLAGAALQPLAPWLPASLRNLHGGISGSAHLESQGLSREEMSGHLRGEATLLVKDLWFGDFDPLAAVVQAGGMGKLEAPRGPVGLRSVVIPLQVQGRRLTVRNVAVDLSGAKLKASASYAFDGTTDLDLAASLKNMRRSWALREEENDADHSRVELHLAGPLKKLSVVPQAQASRVNP